jgi:hypothetical protein
MTAKRLSGWSFSKAVRDTGAIMTTPTDDEWMRA